MVRDQSHEAGTESDSRRRPSRRAFIGTSAAIGAGAFAGCLSTGGDGGGNNSSGGGSGGKALTIGYQPFYAQAWSGAIIKNAGLAEKYLPEGYSVDGWQVALQGAVIGNRMIAGKNDIGYTGDMPTITAIASNDRNIAAVGIAGFSEGQQCNLAVVPSGSSISQPQGLGGKTFGITTGTCTHRFMLRMAEEEGIDYSIQDQGINSILAGIRQGSLPAGFGWEPTFSRLVTQTDAAEYLLSGAPYDVPDAAGIIMPDSLLNNHPEAAKAWMKAELEAKHIMRTDHQRAVDLVAQEQELSNYDKSTIEHSMYTNLDINPDVDRLEFVTDYGEVPPAETLLKQNGPQYLKQQGFIDAIPESSRYKLNALNEAVSELQSEVDWTPAGGRSGNATNESTNPTGGNATGNTTGNTSG